ncbi:MAG TPA: DUF4166 domain-containing protein [Rhizomicrobium sp.]|nr:DUF4166 domain-containing protein [Rhizomicrobium sp.]
MLPQRREAHASPPESRQNELGDLRFRNLLSREDWAALPAAIRHRFSRRVAGGATAIYAGEIVATELAFAGWIAAQLARLVGSPLPRSRDAHVPAVVSVTEDGRTGGQIWTRVYARKSGFPHVIHSAKRFAGTTGLEEHVSRGVGMALTVRQENGALVFRSTHYFFRIGPVRLTLPAWLTPGALTVTHAEEGGGQFSFLLEVVHPAFGRIIRQFAVFHEVAS